MWTLSAIFKVQHYAEGNAQKYSMLAEQLQSYICPKEWILRGLRQTGVSA